MLIYFAHLLLYYIKILLYPTESRDSYDTVTVGLARVF